MGVHSRRAGSARSGSRALGRRPLRVVLFSLPLWVLCGACESPVTPPAAPKSLYARVPVSQFGAPGQPAYLSPIVTVYNQFGLPMPNVLVHFTVTGGSLERTEVLSDSSGLAAPGTWTLRSTEGEDVVTATADGVEPLRFRIRVRIPVELATYALESQGGQTVPFEYAGGSVLGGTFSFYEDGTWVHLTNYRNRSGAAYTGQMQGTYGLDRSTLTGTDGFERNPWNLSATFSGNRLFARFYDPVDWWDEVHVEVRADPTWP